MSLVLAMGLRKPVIRVGRMAGQYAKPRSADFETRDGRITSYNVCYTKLLRAGAGRGDVVAALPAQRLADPEAAAAAAESA